MGLANFVEQQESDRAARRERLEKQADIAQVSADLKRISDLLARDLRFVCSPSLSRLTFPEPQNISSAVSALFHSFPQDQLVSVSGLALVLRRIAVILNSAGDPEVAE